MEIPKKLTSDLRIVQHQIRLQLQIHQIMRIKQVKDPNNCKLVEDLREVEKRILNFGLRQNHLMKWLRKLLPAIPTSKYVIARTIGTTINGTHPGSTNSISNKKCVAISKKNNNHTLNNQIQCNEKTVKTVPTDKKKSVGKTCEENSITAPSKEKLQEKEGNTKFLLKSGSECFPSSNKINKQSSPSTEKCKQQLSPSTDKCKQQSPPSTEKCKQQTPPSTEKCKQQSPPSTEKYKQQSPPSTEKYKQQSSQSTEKSKQQSSPSTDKCKQQSPPSTEKCKQQSPPSTEKCKQQTSENCPCLCEPLTAEKQKFLSAVGLVTRDILKELQNRRVERKRRSTANHTQFVYGSNWDVSSKKRKKNNYLASSPKQGSKTPNSSPDAHIVCLKHNPFVSIFKTPLPISNESRTEYVEACINRSTSSQKINDKSSSSTLIRDIDARGVPTPVTSIAGSGRSKLEDTSCFVCQKGGVNLVCSCKVHYHQACAEVVENCVACGVQLKKSITEPLMDSKNLPVLENSDQEPLIYDASRKKEETSLYGRRYKKENSTRS